MKKCPFCKADIEDNANFCLYCMTSLNKKTVITASRKNGILMVLAAVFLVGAAVVALSFMLPGNDDASQPQTELQQTVGPAQDVEPEISTDAEKKAELTPPESTSSTEYPSQPGNSGQTTYQPPIFTLTPSQPVATQPEVTQPPENTSPKAETEPENIPTEPPLSETEPEPTQAETTPPASQSAFVYRTAQRADVYSATYNNSSGDIVITGISTLSPNGVYHIPAYIDGHRVIAIVGNAFSGSNVRSVYVPETVNNICKFAFYGCALTDIYFSGNSIHLEEYALPEGVTIHCSATCHDTVYHTFKNYAESWGYHWEEWNG